MCWFSRRDNVVGGGFKRGGVADHFVQHADDIGELGPCVPVLLPAVQHQLVQHYWTVHGSREPEVLLDGIDHLQHRRYKLPLIWEFLDSTVMHEEKGKFRKHCGFTLQKWHRNIERAKIDVWVLFFLQRFDIHSHAVKKEAKPIFSKRKWELLHQNICKLLPAWCWSVDLRLLKGWQL